MCFTMNKRICRKEIMFLRTLLYKQVIRHPYITGVCLIVCLYAVVELIRSNDVGLSRFLHRKSDQLKTADYIDLIAKSLDVHIHPPDNVNVEDGHAITLNVRFTNKGHADILYERWAIFFNSFPPMQPETLACGMVVQHVNGNLYFMTPAEELFIGIRPQSSLLCQFHVAHRAVARSDFLPHWYVADLEGRLKSKIIASTAGDSLSFVGSFETQAQWKNGPQDQFNPFTAKERYHRNQIPEGTPSRLVLPSPKYVKKTKSKYIIFDTKLWRLLPSSDFPKLVLYLSERLPISVSASNEHLRKNYIQLKQSNDVEDDEGYHFVVNSADESVHIIAKSSAGAFYGVQTLLSILASDASQIPVVEILDKPRYSYRGVMIDVARNFQAKESILKFIDVMSTYKLNKLHLHLSDDEGWRLEIPGLPALTELGSKRCHSEEDMQCLIPSLGSGPFPTPPGSGFYTTSEYREILKYASDRHVQVIPEIDMPGHARAAIQSMKKRAMERKDPSYALSDDDASAESIQNWLGNAITPCMNSTYRFIEKILDTLIILHKNVQDLHLFHFGGDEVAAGAWDNSPSCKILARQNAPVSYDVLKQLFVHTVSGIANRKGLSLVAWEDGMYEEGRGPFPRREFKNKDMFVIPWANIWERGTGGRAIEFADEGYKVIIAMATHLYFDHPYEPDPEERGLHWATRYTDTEKAFGFMPENIFANADINMFGQQYDVSELCSGSVCPKTKRPENVVGLQACLWSETIRSATHLQYMAFPRVLALAERAWHKASWEDIDNEEERKLLRKMDWKSFAKTLGDKELPRLDGMGILYRVPPPGAIFDGDSIRVNTLYPNHDVEISTDGQTWPILVRDDNPIHIQSYKNISIRSVSRHLRRKSRVINIQMTTTTNSSTSCLVAATHAFYLILLLYICTFIQY